MANWDKKYAQREVGGQPCYTLASHKHLLSDEGKALDIASGLGANAIFLAELGWSVDAWDYSSTAMSKLQTYADTNKLSITTELIDLEVEKAHPLLQQQKKYDLISVSNYLYRPIFNYLVHLLKPNGLLIYETFYFPNTSGTGPSNKEFLLLPNELPKLLAPLNIITHVLSKANDTSRPANKVFYCGKRSQTATLLNSV